MPFSDYHKYIVLIIMIFLVQNSVIGISLMELMVVMQGGYIKSSLGELMFIVQVGYAKSNLKNDLITPQK